MEMEIGMLWFDNDAQANMPSKVEKAARYYLQKYGVDPDVCYVHPQMIAGGNGKGNGKNGGEPLQIGRVAVFKNEGVLPDHLWIGVSNGRGKFSSGA
jgi:hypothetical protein